MRGMMMVLGLAAGMAFSQQTRPLEYSRTSMRLERGYQDTLLIKNPNPAALVTDSMVLLLDSNRLSGLLYFEAKAPDGSEDQFVQLWPRRIGDPEKTLRFVFKPGPDALPGSDGRLTFPGNRTLEFVWRIYDPCPVCKRSAAPAQDDSLRARLVFHLGRRADTLRLTLHRSMAVALAPGPAAVSAASRTAARDLLGRRWRASGRAAGSRFRTGDDSPSMGFQGRGTR